MPYTETAEDYIKQFKETINEWKPRLEVFKRVYKVLSLYDELEDKSARPEERLESFVSNDPRVMHNMALFLLTPPAIPFNIPSDGYDQVIQNAATNIEKAVRTEYDRLDAISMRSSNGGSWLHHFNNLMLATGWYSVFAWAQDDEFIADIWSPAETFPNFDQEGLADVVNFSIISASRARKRIAEAGWPVKITSNTPVEVYNYWCFDDEGKVHNCVIIAGQKAIEKSYDHIKELPVATAGVAGLPDRGVLSLDFDVADWHETVGQSLVATDEGVFKAFNRLMTFMMQITRDTAQPRIVEKVKGGTKVVTAENWNKRGAIYRLDIDEDIGAVPMPGMPPEVSLGLQMMDGMKQRGGFDYSLFQGGQASAAAQAITSASAQQILLPFKSARDFALNFVCNQWASAVKSGFAKFPKYEVPSSFPEELVFKTDIKISVPGDLIQRATTARTLDPEFKLSHAKTIELTMPEVTNPNDEVIAARIDNAMANPAFGIIDTIEALEQTAEALEAEGQTRHAERYRNLAAKYEQTLDQQVNGQQKEKPPGLPGQSNVGQ